MSEAATMSAAASLQMLGAPQLAKLLHLRSEATLRRYEAEHGLPFVQIHPRAPHLYPVVQVHAWLLAHMCNGMDGVAPETIVREMEASAARRQAAAWATEALGSDGNTGAALGAGAFGPEREAPPRSGSAP